jgi:DNA-binding FadR family transcriptional regulator
MRERIVAPRPQGPGSARAARIFDVRHQAVREAIADLRRRGYLRTVADKGTYVRPPRDWA